MIFFFCFFFTFFFLLFVSSSSFCSLLLLFRLFSPLLRLLFCPLLVRRRSSIVVLVRLCSQVHAVLCRGCFLLCLHLSPGSSLLLLLPLLRLLLLVVGCWFGCCSVLYSWSGGVPHYSCSYLCHGSYYCCYSTLRCRCSALGTAWSRRSVIAVIVAVSVAVSSVAVAVVAAATTTTSTSIPAAPGAVSSADA